MLFDLRGKGRRRTVKIVYITLAFLMGGGLVLFGIGGETSGGLVDAITGTPDTDSGESRYEKREAAALAKIRANQSDEEAWVELIRVRNQLAALGDRYDAEKNTYTEAGKAELRSAAEAWEDYQATEPKNGEQESRAARIMVRAYVSLEDPAGATSAQEIVAEQTEAAGPYEDLALFAYAAGQTRKGDLAAKKALSLTDEDLRGQLKQSLDQAKAQGALQAAGADGAAAAPTATP